MGKNFLLGTRGISCRPAVLGAGFAAALLVAGTTTASAATFFIPTEADTYIFQTSGATNFGGSVDLDVRSQQARSNHHNKRTLLRFNLASLAGCTIISAELRLIAVDITGQAKTRPYDLHFVSDDAWIEGSVTWNTAPGHDGTETSSEDVPDEDAPVEMVWVGLGTLVTNELPGKLSLLIKDEVESDGAPNKETLFNSKEAGGDDADKPLLIVEAECAGIQPGDFRTQTQGGWSTAAHGGNPGTYRDANFDSCFDPALIGHEPDFNVQFTSSSAIEAFLPQGGTPGVLSATTANPTTTDAGVLASQVLALLLSVEFDLCDPDFGASATNLANLVVDDPTDVTECDGLTVQEVLDLANLIIGDAALFDDLTPSEINACVASINENFVDGTVVGTYLKLP